MRRKRKCRASEEFLARSRSIQPSARRESGARASDETDQPGGLQVCFPLRKSELRWSGDLRKMGESMGEKCEAPERTGRARGRFAHRSTAVNSAGRTSCEKERGEPARETVARFGIRRGFVPRSTSSGRIPCAELAVAVPVLTVMWLAQLLAK